MVGMRGKVLDSKKLWKGLLSNLGVVPLAAANKEKYTKATGLSEPSRNKWAIEAPVIYSALE